MSVWAKIRQIRNRQRIYHRDDIRLLTYVYKFPGKSYWTSYKHVIKRYTLINIDGFMNEFNNLLEDRLIVLKSWETKSDSWHLRQTHYNVYPSKELSNTGLWLVNHKTGELIRPLTKVEELIGRYYKRNNEVYIGLPIYSPRANKQNIYEIVDGFEYGAKSYTRDKRRNRRLKG